MSTLQNGGQCYKVYISILYNIIFSASIIWFPSQCLKKYSYYTIYVYYYTDQQEGSSMQADDSIETGDTDSDHVEVTKVDLKRNFLAWQVSLI